MRILMRRTTFMLALAGLAAPCAAPAMAAGTPAGTVISNQATVDYTDSNGNPLQTLSNVVTTVVSQVASLTVDPDRSVNTSPGAVIFYAHTVTNFGNAADTIDMLALSSNGWATALYADVDGSGTFTAGDVPLTDSDIDGTADTGVVAADGTFRILANVTVPAAAADGTIDSTIVTGTSSFNVAIFDTALDTTTINAPDMNVVKSVAPSGPQPPGATLTYTIVVINSGTGDSVGVVLTDPVPANTTFVPASITLNSAGKTDAGADDEADFGVTTGGAVTVSIGTLAPGASATVTFQVTIN